MNKINIEINDLKFEFHCKVYNLQKTYDHTGLVELKSILSGKYDIENHYDSKIYILNDLQPTNISNSN